MADGYLNKCKDCQKANTAAARARRPDYYLEYDRNRGSLPHRVAARKEYMKTEEGRAAHAKALRKQIKLYPKKASARYAVSGAIQSGKLIKQPCFICGSKKVEAHHPDYDKPLEVVWLCNKHHREAHSLLTT